MIGNCVSATTRSLMRSWAVPPAPNGWGPRLLERERQSARAGGYRLVRSELVVPAGEEVVVVAEAVVLHVEGEAAEAAADGEQDALCAAFRDVDLGGDGVRAVLDVGGGEEIDGRAARAVDVLVAHAAGPGTGAAAAGERGLKGQHLVARGLDPPEVLELAELVGALGGEVVGSRRSPRRRGRAPRRLRRTACGGR